MVDTGAPVLEMNLIAPLAERMDQLSKEIWNRGYASLDGAAKLEIYKVCQMEQQVSALTVLAQFCAGAR